MSIKFDSTTSVAAADKNLYDFPTPPTPEWGTETLTHFIHWSVLVSCCLKKDFYPILLAITSLLYTLFF
jgi:hypothetical protein